MQFFEPLFSLDFHLLVGRKLILEHRHEWHNLLLISRLFNMDSQLLDEFGKVLVPSILGGIVSGNLLLLLLYELDLGLVSRRFVLERPFKLYWIRVPKLALDFFPEVLYIQCVFYSLLPRFGM